ncbi:MAG: aldolase/citrate lyase family protein [Candidatus Dormiibacterota bacterium]
MTTLRELFDGGQVTYGGWCGIPSPFAAELVGRSGFDWVTIDTQHGLVGYDTTVPMLQALSATGTPAFVRVPWNQPDHIMKALDAGAQGIIVPMVGTADDARRAVDSVKYPPLGHRSWGPVRSSFELPGYSPASANERTVVAAMIETPEGVENMDAIMQVEGIDAIYVGPSDLGLSHGFEPTLDMPAGSDHEKLLLSVLEGCLRNHVVPGLHTAGVENATRWREAGFRMLTISSDGAFLRSGATAALQRLREGAPAAAASSSPYS